MAKGDKHQKGTDEPITIQVNESGGGYDLSTLEGYGVIFYYKDTNTQIVKYSKNAASGWNDTDVDTTNQATGGIDIYFQRALSESLNVGAIVMGQVQIQSTDTNYLNDEFRDMCPPFELFEVQGGGPVSTDDLNP